MSPARKYTTVTPEVRAEIKLCKGVKSALTLSEEHCISRAHIYRIWNDITPLGKKKVLKKTSGRPKKLSNR